MSDAPRGRHGENVASGGPSAPLTEAQRQQLDALLDLLASDTHAPTAVRERASASQIHVADSLAALELEVVREARQIVDIGSGAGFPGLALAVAMPDAEFVLLESQRRKCDFLARARRAACAGNVTVVCARAEEWREGLGSRDAVLARAVASQPVVLEYAAPLLRPGGHLVDWRGVRDSEEEAAADRAAGELGLARAEVREVKPFPAARNRYLHVFAKVAETPPRFPRRAGIAQKRPLGS
jgi:16S rRNA (guanine527-N7)-methyltransferase